MKTKTKITASIPTKEQIQEKMKAKKHGAYSWAYRVNIYGFKFFKKGYQTFVYVKRSDERLDLSRNLRTYCNSKDEFIEIVQKFFNEILTPIK